MNRISGRVVLRESGAGIPDVLVVVYDIDPGWRGEEVIEGTDRSGPPPEALSGGDRMGSVLTRKDGAFDLEFEDADFRGRNPDERRPDLLLQVLAPEEPGLDAESALLFLSRIVRQGAGRVEEYLIRLTADQLTKAGIAVPSRVGDDAEPAHGRVERLKEARVRAAAIVGGTLEVARERVLAHRQHFQAFDEKLQPALASSLSTVPAAVLEPHRLVGPDESPFVKNGAVIAQNIREVLNSNDPAIRAPIRGFISLTEDEVLQLQQQVDGDGNVPESVVRTVTGEKGATSFVQRTELLPLCRPTAHEDCFASLDTPSPEPTPVPPDVTPPSPVDELGPDDIPKFVGRMLNSMTAPEEQLLTGLTPTATLATIQKSVRELSFEPSPADVPAFHDFNQLQIAFQHVWQELTDKGVLDIARDAYETIVELGGDPTRPEYATTLPTHALQAEAALALRAVKLAPPPEVRDHRGGDTDPSTASGGTVVTPTVRDHRNDPLVRLPALLNALEARMREKYSFTIFAANAKERSINFGVLLTFRQRWTPLSYQAGPLVKSIPLAPKQTQKVVVTRKFHKKRVQKELENNLRVVREETSRTSRAEQEIVKRASAKTEFSHSNTASGGVEGVGSDTSTTTFKQEAAKSTDDTKKSFHEAVFKSAQEFKHERTTEITTETTEDFETTETTEIGNPNDEIAVTYLFYELQRCYRLHERLFRVTPVVLVAQEVPAPHEIDQDWLIAHDWILKRIILDDSFLPTLETLSQSSGAETALAQLAANVTQQRQIVAQLREELAIAKKLTAVPRNLLQDALGLRTGGGGLVGGLVSGTLGQVGNAVNSVSDMIFGGGADQNRSNRDALTSAAEEAADRARDLMFRLEREVTALNSITETYARALQAHHTHLTEIARLRVHVKENILHYMQGIWRHEHPDQRFFRLHNVPIPTLRKQQSKFRIDFNRPRAVAHVLPHLALDRFGGRQALAFPLEAFCQFPERFEYKPLCEVADLGNPLGYKGNYAVFPLLESNPLTDFMMEPYIDRATHELVDPSDPSGFSLDEFAQYVCCLKEELTAEEFETLRPRLKEHLQAILTSPRRNDDVLVVPTDSLFIEALPAAHALIERFKKDHRMIDVKKAQAELREKELENVRRAARILAGEREDPDIDKKVLIEGAHPIVET